MKNKPILCPHRLRHVPRQFSWIDQRLVGNRHIQGPSAQALALYLFLCTVADAQGVSYYSDASVVGMLGWDADTLRRARRELIEAALIAWGRPFYQVLSLDPEKMEGEAAQEPENPERSLAQMLAAMRESLSRNEAP
jgi:hypothetical protein